MTRPLLLDLFCGAGGAAMGYHRAGFDVIGVDINPQPRYPFEFHRADAVSFLRNEWQSFDAIHASPVCKKWSLATLFHPGRNKEHPDLIAPTREALAPLTGPWVIENVPGAPVRRDVVLCGEMFGLRLHRHRWFEIGRALVLQPPHPRHKLRGALTNCHVEDGHARLVAGNFADLDSASEAMGIDWMNRAELAQAIPPAYTEFIGHQLLAHLGRAAA